MGGGNVSSAISDVARDAFDLGNVRGLAQQEIGNVGYEMTRPSTVMRPEIYIDGDRWCALYGKNIQDGVAGFGDSPAKAMENFDENWRKDLPAPTGR